MSGSLTSQGPKTLRRRRAAPRAEASPLGEVRERRFVTVLFADLCESTRRARGLDPEDTHSDLEPALRLICETVTEVGGIVSQVEGDGVQALFGAPLAQEDHALRACLAATALHQRARALAERGEGRYTLRVGVDSGEIVVGSVREYRTRRIRADGLLLNRVRRLETAARPGSTLIGAATLRLAEGHVKVLDSRMLEAAGFDTPLEAYELAQTAVAPLASRRQLAPLIGRDPLLAALREQAAAARLGQLHVIGLRGEAGVGKSRIARTLGEQLQSEGFGFVWAQAHAIGPRLPFDALADLALALLEVPASATERTDAAHRALSAAGSQLAAHAATLSELVNVGDASTDWLALSPALRRRRLADLMVTLFEHRLHRGPLLLVADDLMHADRESLRLLETVLRRLERAPLLVCATYRSDFAHRWSDEAWFGEVPVVPLDDRHAGEMAHAILGGHPSVKEVASALGDRAGGNPFFLEQLAMALVDEGCLVGDPGAYRCPQPLQALRPPPSVHALVMSRVDRLPPLCKRLLECASVLGALVVCELLARMAGVGEPDSESGLRQAAAAGLLVEAAGAPVGAFRFRHSLIQEIVLASLARPRRRDLHRAAHDALRAHPLTAGGDDAAQLAHHAYAGEAWPEAAEWSLRAMTLAIARSAHRDALNYLSVGLDATARGNAADPVQRLLELRLRMTALSALSPLGKIDEAVSHLSRAHAITRELNDHRRESGVALQLAFVRWVQGDYDNGLAAAAAAQVSAQRSAGRSAQMAALQARMMLRHGQGRYRDVLAEAARVERDFGPELAELELLPRWATIPSINLHVFAADALTQIGEYAAAQVRCDRGYADVARNDHAYSHILLDWVQGSLWLAQGRVGVAAARIRSALVRSREHDVPTMEPPLVCRLCSALARGGDAPQALALIEQAIANRLDALGGRYNAFYFPAAHAEALAAAGQPHAALARARAALQAAQTYGQRGYEAQAALQGAEIAASAGLTGDAADLYAHALALAAECGMSIVEEQAAQGLRPAAT